MGAIGSATMIIPGVSGSALLMTFGYYTPIYGAIGDLTNADSTTRGNDALIALAFLIGTAVGIWAVAKLIEMLLKKFEIQSYWGIIGFVLARRCLDLRRHRSGRHPGLGVHPRCRPRRPRLLRLLQDVRYRFFRTPVTPVAGVFSC